MTTMLKLVLLVVSVTPLVACAETASGPPITITGSVLILDSANFSSSGPTCSGSDDFSSLRRGAEVSVDGDVIGVLSDGFVTEEGNCRLLFDGDIPNKEGDLKRYDFRVEGMPSVTGMVNTEFPIDWQSPNADGWVTIGWDG